MTGPFPSSANKSVSGRQTHLPPPLLHRRHNNHQPPPRPHKHRLLRRLRRLHLPHRRQLLLLLHPLRIRHAKQAPPHPGLGNPLGPLQTRPLGRPRHHCRDRLFRLRSFLVHVARRAQPEYPGHELLRLGFWRRHDLQHAVLGRVR